jgi:hypothetical protein
MWLNGGEHPEIVEWITTTQKAIDRKLPDDLLDEDDVLHILDHAKNHRTAAFMAMLWGRALVGQGVLEAGRCGATICLSEKSTSRCPVH